MIIYDCLELCVQLLYFIFAGFIGSLFSLLQFVCCPLIGAISDVYGRRLPLMFCMVSKMFAFHKTSTCSSNQKM